ncbi:YihY/virulence factor BrkB family protein [Halobacteriovorax sp. GFR7]|uniref:YihY/virulence factor BrkB family protein n=1 Tax=unclassified Halobacteriovorax TaxID=2639665 RepID=UPI003D9760C9
MKKYMNAVRLDPDKIEKDFLEFCKTFVLRLIASIFLFKKRKGEVLAGATTFFTILSFGPAIMILISIIGAYLGDSDTAKEHIISMIFSNFPQIDTSVLNAIKHLVEEQVKGSFVDWHQLGLWFFACLGISTSFIFGINTLSKVDIDGGMIQDDLRSAIFGVVLALFFLIVSFLMEKNVIVGLLSNLTTHSNELYYLIELLLLPFTITTFALVYKVSAQIKVSYKDALCGACVFVMCFFIGKSTYWVYLKYFKDDLVSDYGSFYNLLVAMIWVYYIICSFYLGACYTYVPKIKIFNGKKRGKR